MRSARERSLARAIDRREERGDGRGDAPPPPRDWSRRCPSCLVRAVWEPRVWGVVRARARLWNSSAEDPGRRKTDDDAGRLWLFYLLELGVVCHALNPRRGSKILTFYAHALPVWNTKRSRAQSLGTTSQLSRYFDESRASLSIEGLLTRPGSHSRGSDRALFDIRGGFFRAIFFPLNDAPRRVSSRATPPAPRRAARARRDARVEARERRRGRAGARRRTGRGPSPPSNRTCSSRGRPTPRDP